MKLKRIAIVIFVAYCIFIVWYTLFTRTANIERTADFRFMWAYREMLTGDANWKKDVIQNLSNIAFFIPYGILFPVKKCYVVLVSSFVFSVLIETAQYVYRLGLCELDDVICNTLGAMIGFWIVFGFLKVIKDKHEY